jgi:MFS transporter, putative metabolite:H+ symporter
LYTATQLKRAIPERIDRLPASREIWRILLLAGVAWLIESYDIGIMGNALPSLSAQYQPSSFLTGTLTTASTFGLVIAIIPAGRLADRIGRKQVLILGTAWYALFTLLCGFSSNISLLIAFRFISGLGMGAVFPIPYAMASELTSRHIRGAMTAFLDSFLSFGYFLSPLLALWLIPNLGVDVGWRILFYIGGIPLLYVPVLYKWLPESPRWLQIKGRHDEADRIVRYLENAVERRTGAPLPEPEIEDVSPGEQVNEKASRSRFQREYIRRTVMMCVIFACIFIIFYAVQTFTPTVLIKQGYGVGNAFLLTTIIVIASIPGKYAAGYAVERWGRKPTLIWFSAVAAISAVVFGFAPNAVVAIIFGCLMSFFGIGVDPVVKIYGAEQYPTHIRETGVSIFEGVGRLFSGVLAPYIMVYLLTSFNVAGSYIFIAVVALIGVGVVAMLGTETRGEPLEKVSNVALASARRVS